MELTMQLWRLELLIRIGAVYQIAWNRRFGSALAMAWRGRKVFCIGNKEMA